MKRPSIFAGLLAACLLALGLTATAPLVEQAYAATSCNVYVGDTLVTTDNAHDVLGDGGTVSYLPDTNTLVLYNASITTARSWKSEDGRAYAGITSESDSTLTIELIGTNRVTVPSVSNRDISYGILAATDHSGKLVIRGDGTLTVKANEAQSWSFGIFAKTVTVRDQVTVTAHAAKAAYGSYGFYLRKKIVSKADASIIGIGKTAAFNKAPTFGSNYTPLVSAGASKSSISITKKNPQARVYTKNRYVSVTNAFAGAYTPGPMQIIALEAIEGGFNVKWTTLPENCTGYVIQLSSNKKFTPPCTTTTHIAPSAAITGFDITGLVPESTYYLRVRGANDMGSTTYYGTWSDTVSATLP